MVALTKLLISALPVLSVAHAASSVLDLLPNNFDSIVLKSGKPALVEFFAPWCGHCKTLAPIYEQLAEVFPSSKVSIAKVDADEHKSLGKRFGVQGFPTLKWFDGKSDTPEDYKGGRDLESLKKFVEEKTGAKGKAKKAAPSHVTMLDGTSFVKEVGAEKDVFVAFTAPWCGHCKTLAPVWEKFSEDFSTESGVLIAKVDAEAENSKALAGEQGVSSYPTIKYFPKGSKVAEDYNGARSESALVDWVNTKAGTDRTVGGGLGTKAGTIENLDSIVAKLTNGNVAYITEEVKKASNGLKGVYAEYYSKVLTKLGTNQGYATKELARLQNIIERGGLAPTKLDEMVGRSNILRSFASPMAEAPDKEEL